MNGNRPDDRHWHLDKRVPVALIITILLQTVAAVWWAASLSARVDVLERDWARFATVAARLRVQEDRQTRADVRLQSLTARLERIERKLDVLLERRAERPGYVPSRPGGPK